MLIYCSRLIIIKREQLQENMSIAYIFLHINKRSENTYLHHIIIFIYLLINKLIIEIHYTTIIDFPVTK